VSVADVIAHHVVWELESIDRMYCNVYVPQLQREGGVVHFFRHHRGYPFASSVLIHRARRSVSREALPRRVWRMVVSQTMTRALLAFTLAAVVAGCATGRSSTVPTGSATDPRYLYQLLDARKLGAEELARIQKANPAVASYMAQAGRPDFVIEPGPSDLQLIYYSRSVLVHFHQGADGVWTSSQLTPLPASLLGVLPEDIRAGTPVPSTEMTGCWATTITGGSCQTCCTPPDTPAAQNCTIQCKPGRS
jgi:hypothetical protein